MPFAAAAVGAERTILSSTLLLTTCTAGATHAPHEHCIPAQW